jgi:hypothetical protein
MIVGIAAEHWLLDAIDIHGENQVWFLVPLSALLGFALRFRFRQYADLVEDCGDSLHVVLQGRDFSFPLGDVASVALSVLGSSRNLVKLQFKKGKAFEGAIRFYGALPSERPTIQADLERLKVRIEARQRDHVA